MIYHLTIAYNFLLVSLFVFMCTCVRAFIHVHASIGSFEHMLIHSSQNVHVWIFIPYLIRMQCGHDLFSQIYDISAVNTSKQEVSWFYFQIKSSR